MTLEERMAAAEAQGRDYFRQGLNCTECVLRTFMDRHETGLPDDILCLASGFGNGMGNTKHTCGAVVGAVLAISAAKGKNPFTLETPAERIAHKREDVYPSVSGLIHEIENEFGTLICRELSDRHGDFDSRERKKSCQQLIGYCCSLVEKYAGEIR